MHPHHNPVHISEDYDENNNAKVVTHLPSAEGKQLFNRHRHRNDQNHYPRSFRRSYQCLTFQVRILQFILTANRYEYII